MGIRDGNTRKLSDRVIIRELKENELGEAEMIVHLAFGTFLHIPDAIQNPAEKRLLTHRWRRNPEDIIAAELDGKLVGTNVVTRWGSFAFFGPLTVRPEFWDSGIASRMMESTMGIFEKWGVTHTGLFTFADSPKHLGLYHKFGYHARFLTSIMTKEIDRSDRPITNQKFITFSECGTKGKEKYLEECRELTAGLYPGLDLSSEISLVDDYKLGDTLMLLEDSKLSSFATCQNGPNTEAGKDKCFVKFGAARRDSRSGERFENLILACQSFSRMRGASSLEAGVNLSHSSAFDLMLKHGFRTTFLGVAMQKPNAPAFNLEENYIMDDWR
ncbi:MAG: GNAT family N-acetyltransferase [Thaumarchaeota archaeon]|nr:GNAT family N-acetyltransferase [Nitrososphaerota archaeon]